MLRIGAAEFVLTKSIGDLSEQGKKDVPRQIEALGSDVMRVRLV